MAIELKDLDSLCAAVYRLLKHRKVKIVFAESCTGGLVSAALTRQAGVSEVLCGSQVVYRLDSKARWLGLSKAALKNPVSEQTALEMAFRVLERTPESGLACSITGHLGPHAPRSQDGVVWVGFAVRKKRQIGTFTQKIHLPKSSRRTRQLAASQYLLSMVRSLLT